MFVILIFFTVLAQCFNGKEVEVVEEEEVFTEELLLRPLPDRKVLTHFHFEHKAPFHHQHYRLFPKAIHQLVQKFRIREMELSFTQGRWNYERWGGFDPVSSRNVKPPGVELWAVFDVPPNQVDETWKNLTHTLSGLFCASINFLESTTAYSAPVWGFQKISGGLRYGALPREAVCTENITPWLKLLPCRDKAGLASILERPSIYNGFYHSQRLRLISRGFESQEGVKPEIVLQQTLTAVLQSDSQRTMTTNYGKKLQTSWSIRSIFGRKPNDICVLAKSSTIFLELDRGLVYELNKLGVELDTTSADNAAFELTVIPTRVIKEEKSSLNEGSPVVYEFSMDKFSPGKLQDIGLTWKHPIVWACLQAPYHTNRFLMGSGNERGSIAISLRSTHSGMGSRIDNVVDGSKVEVVVFQVVPWYVKVYYHTLQVFIDGQPKMVADVVEKLHVSPSEDKVSTGAMEMILKFPSDANLVVLTMEFDKGFLHIDEYPPDANQGFDIPSAVISFPNSQASITYLKENFTSSPMLQKFKEKSVLLSYTEVLLVPLATPDFSMPYNVITITCTVFALYFGSLLNALRRRVGEEERIFESKDSTKIRLVPLLLQKLFPKLRTHQQQPQSSSPSSLLRSKLIFKVILVAGLAIGWHFYFG
ncbi:hypothetical protein AQUCO_05700152v1 [Aquilegia coerulea]|uniref:GPI transamidase component PIG-T n=1 Tax=Aquilegia coerulea TaxID=218851 RepID=A0A2G5CG29_AQUCA|nr:hypothetical protein AQUCO_05700152v1 [Aquilegia coerulea]PIA30244.1 hypothetical protein AQUCO_05700152v1 [Aquilegia coerulea]